jgi:CHAT domain-containing protein/tetratricopeptide (TPR) repeat protein
MMLSFMRPSATWPTVSRLAIVAALCLPLRANSAAAPGYLDQLATLVAHTGTRIAPRLTISPPTPLATDPSPSPELLQLAAQLHAAVAAGSTDPNTMHAAALATLIWADTSNFGPVDSAIVSLESALRVAGPDAPILADLAAAHLVRAEYPGGECHLLRALNAADSALALDPRNSTAIYNWALALDRLWLGEEAGQAWHRFLRMEAHTGWSGRARERLRAFPALPKSLLRPGDDVPENWRRLAERDPQRARSLVTDTILPEWGRAVLRGDSVTARLRLRSAASVAVGLARRRRDASVRDMVRAIQLNENDVGTTRALASAHARYGGAQGLLNGRRAVEAADEFRQVTRIATASRALREWARFSLAVSLFYQGKADSAVASFRQTVERNEGSEYPVLVARARWGVGTGLLRARSYALAEREYQTASGLLEQAGELEYLGAIHGLRFETLFSLGDPDAAYGEMVRALRILSHYPHSVYLHNLLYVAAQACRAEGMSRSARALEDFDVQTSARIGPAVHAEALLVRARGRAAAGQTRAAARDAAVARRLMNSLPTEFQRSWIENDLTLVNAQVLAWTDPAAAAAALDTAVSFYGRRGIGIRLLPALVLRAETRLHARNAVGALADLDSAASLVGALDKSVASASLRAQMMESGRALYDRLVMVHARAGRPTDALWALERGRASFGPITATATQAAASRLVAPPGETVLEYALIGDTLLAFTLTGATLDMAILPLPAEILAREVSALRAALESGAREESVRGRLAWLYETLVQPVRMHIPAGAPLVIVADGEIVAVPFTALASHGNGRYLIQEHAIRVAPSIAQAKQPSGAATAASQAPAVFVADPALSPGDRVRFPALPVLARITHGIAGRVPGSTVLDGLAADHAAVRAAMTYASLFHFSGHAVFDDDHPGRSYLLLAPDSSGPGRLTADEIALLDLRGVRLVVLSACETQSSVSSRSGGFAGLSGAILSAGATGVLGSLWHVGEVPTAQLMSEFYRGYTTRSSGATALQLAQIRMISSRDPALSSPSAWAGFRFAGR